MDYLQGDGCDLLKLDLVFVVVPCTIQHINASSVVHIVDIEMPPHCAITGCAYCFRALEVLWYLRYDVDDTTLFLCGCGVCLRHHPVYRMRVICIKGRTIIREMPDDGVLISSSRYGPNKYGTLPHVPLYLERANDISQCRTLESLSDGKVWGRTLRIVLSVN